MLTHLQGYAESSPASNADQTGIPVFHDCAILNRFPNWQYCKLLRSSYAAREVARVVCSNDGAAVRAAPFSFRRTLPSRREKASS